MSTEIEDKPSKRKPEPKADPIKLDLMEHLAAQNPDRRIKVTHIHGSDYRANVLKEVDNGNTVKTWKMTYTAFLSVTKTADGKLNIVDKTIRKPSF